MSSAETSLVRYLNGGPPMPGFVPPRPSEQGVRGRPDAGENVETLANLALISRHGADWFRAARDRVGAGVGAGHGVRRGTAARASTRSPSARRSGTCSAGGRPRPRSAACRRCWPAGTSAAGCRAGPRSARPPPRTRCARPGRAFGAGVLVLLRRPRLRAGRDRAGGPLPGGPERRAVRPVPERPAGPRRRAEQLAFGSGSGGRDAHGRALRWPRTCSGLVERARRLPPARRGPRLVASALQDFADDVRAHERGPCLARAPGRPRVRAAVAARDHPGWQARR